jgi:hypothetical protein
MLIYDMAAAVAIVFVMANLNQWYNSIVLYIINAINITKSSINKNVVVLIQLDYNTKLCNNNESN